MRVLIFTLLLAATSVLCYSKTTKMIFNETDIIVFVQTNNIEGVADLLNKGANVNTSDNNQRSLLLIATQEGLTEMAALLVKHGADVNQQADNLDSPFLYAGASGQTELVQLFLDHGARFDIFNRYHGSALIPACERGHVETVRLLANTKNFPINHINRLGWTALMEAVILGDGSKKYQQIVQILKEAGAQLDIADNNGITPLQHAEVRGFKEITELLKRKK
ncbi:ankyrin repeat domain-containing protein [Carboxylicivirga taeanensis]|uniref:ankyrin repeat domain-containing protein n=1 Tax=Carboxylicivirga taeanensis TaxID=1416875 RepID=UPI003F6E3E0A